MTQRPLLSSTSARWPLILAGGLALLAVTLQPSWAQDDPQDPPTAVDPPRFMPSSAGGTADSNNDMIAVTGVDVTGSSVLFLVDTKSKHLVVYQAQGGSGSTQALRMIGARNIGLDLQLDGFNDKTELNGRPLRYKDLEEQFAAQGLIEND